MLIKIYINKIFFIYFYFIYYSFLFDIIKSKGGLKKLSIKEFILKYLDKNATEYVTKGKIKYLYPLCKEMRQLCEKIKKPYSEI